MKFLFSGLVALALLPLSMTAYAADASPKVVYKAPPPAAPLASPATTDWSGFYLGVNGGIANGDGVLVGGTIGYNYQTGPLVLGVETDLDATWANVAAPYLGTVRGRLGYAFDAFMPYFTGGYAYGDHGSSGTALGGGVEIRLMPTLSMKIEYLHVDVDGPDDIVRLGLNLRFNTAGPIVSRY